jgi:predicted pyridoxine 5'-phosphate oxidase superfamily flavin-nucleotide-binding protein
MTKNAAPTEHRITSLEQLRRVIAEPNPVGLSKVLDHLDEQGLAFLRAAPFLLLSTASADGCIEVSPKGDEAGFVHVENERTILIPDRAGNNLAFGLSNIIENPRIGVIVLRPGAGETLRFSGKRRNPF